MLTNEQGRTSNFAHNALRTVCLQVFYDNSSKSLRQFSAFHKTVPSKALILVAAIASMPCMLKVFFTDCCPGSNCSRDLRQAWPGECQANKHCGYGERIPLALQLVRPGQR